MIIARYLLTNILKTQLVIYLILLVIFVNQKLLSVLGDVVNGDIPINIIASLIFLYTPKLSTLILPFSFFVGLFLTMHRLQTNNELVILSNMGLSPFFLIKIGLVLALTHAMVYSLFAFYLEPRFYSIKENIITQYERMPEASLAFLKPSNFVRLKEPKVVIYVENMTQDKQLKSVFINYLEKTHPNEHQPKQKFIIAASGYFNSRANMQKSLILQNGYAYQIPKHHLNYQITQFDEYEMILPKKDWKIYPDEKRLDIIQLKNTDTPKAQAYFHWRIMMPFMFPILVLIALPLSQTKVRHGNFVKIVPAFLIYFTYYIATILARRMLEHNGSPHYLGTWWLHATVLVITILLFYRQYFRKQDTAIS